MAGVKALEVEPAKRESTQGWKAVLIDLKQRGLDDVKSVVSSDHSSGAKRVD